MRGCACDPAHLLQPHKQPSRAPSLLIKTSIELEFLLVVLLHSHSTRAAPLDLPQGCFLGTHCSTLYNFAAGALTVL